MKYLVGVRPNGQLHLGHYASVIKPALKYDADVLIAEYHAPSGGAQTFRRELVKLGVKSNRIKLQRTTFDGQLYFSLLEATPTGLLNHMPQYKEKDKNALMFTYPVLMAHDVANYDYVIVGDDQRPHIEFAKDILHKVKAKCPEPIYEGGKVMDLRHPERKMSKSDPKTCLFLNDPDYKEKIEKAVTDTAGLKNLYAIYHLLGGTQEHFEQNSELKERIILQYEYTFRKKPLTLFR